MGKSSLSENDSACRLVDRVRVPELETSVDRVLYVHCGMAVAEAKKKGLGTELDRQSQRAGSTA